METTFLASMAIGEAANILGFFTDKLLDFLWGKAKDAKDKNRIRRFASELGNWLLAKYGADDELFSDLSKVIEKDEVLKTFCERCYNLPYDDYRDTKQVIDEIIEKYNIKIVNINKIKDILCVLYHEVYNFINDERCQTITELRDMRNYISARLSLLATREDIEEIFRKVIKEILAQMQLQGQKSVLNAVFTQRPVDIGTVPIGRDIDAIGDRLKRDHLLVLNGMGGIGKTLIAKKVFRSTKDYGHIGWVEYRDNMHSSIATAIINSGIRFEQNSSDKDKFELFESVINNCEKPVLLVIDNVNKTSQEDNSISDVARMNCDLLITSRYNQLDTTKNIKIEFLELEDCIKLFKKYYMDEDNDSLINDIVDLAGQHTLTIELLAKTAKGFPSLLKFHTELKAKGFNLSHIKVSGGWDDNRIERAVIEHIQTVFKISGLGNDEELLLKHLSLFGTEPLTKEYISDVLGADSLGPLIKLVEKGWLSGEGATVQMHSVVKAAIDEQYKPEVNESLGIISNAAERLNWDETGYYVDVLSYLNPAIELYNRFQEYENIELGLLTHNIASVLYDKGEYDKALEYYEKSLKITLKSLGAGHPSTGSTYNNMAGVYHAKGDYDIALEFYEKSLNIRLKSLGEDHPDTGSTYNNMAIVYRAKDEYDKALEYYEKSLIINLNSLGAEHPSTGTIYNNMGVIYKSKGEYDKALEYYDNSLKIRLKSLGADHPNTGSTYNNMAGAYQAKGEYDIALMYYNKSLKIKLKTTGSDHPSTGGTYNNMALVYEAKGQYDKALEYYSLACKIFMEKLGEEHPYTQNAMQGLYIVKKKLGMLDDEE